MSDASQKRWAREAARQLTSLRRCEGVPCLNRRGQLVLLSRPQVRPLDPLALCHALCAPGLPGARMLAQAFAASEVLELTSQRLAGWTHKLGFIEPLDALERWIAHGIPALRRWRERDLTAQTERWRIQTARLARQHHLVSSLPAGWMHEERDERTWLLLLELSWQVMLPAELDPARELCSRVWRVQEALLERAQDEARSVSEREKFAALLGQRAQPGSKGRLPQLLWPAFEAGALGSREAIAALLGVGPTRENAALLAALPLTREVPWAPLLLARTSVLMGAPAARHMLKESLQGARALTALQRTCEHVRRTFLEMIQSLQDAHDARDVERWLPQPVQPFASMVPDAQELARCFRAHVSAHAPALPRASVRVLAHAQQRLAPAALMARARAIVDTWHERIQEDETGGKKESNTPGFLALCAVALVAPSTQARLPHDLSGQRARELLSWCKALSPERCAQIWPHLVAHPRASWDQESLQVVFEHQGWSVRDLDLIMEHELHHAIGPLQQWPRQARAYLGMVERLAQADMKELIDVHADWFIKLFGPERAVMADYLLTLASALERALPAEQLLTHLTTLSQHVLQTDSPFEQVLKRWNTAHLSAPHPGLEQLASALELPQDQLVAYLHHRRIATGEEAFSGQLQALLDAMTHSKDSGQLDWLTRTLASADASLDEARRATLQARRAAILARDEDAQRQKLARRARNKLLRGLERARAHSMERLLELAWCEVLGERLGRSIEPEQLPQGLAMMLPLLRSDEGFDRELFFSFLEDLMAGRALHERAPNAAWRARAATLLDTQAWLEGFDVTLTQQEARWRIYTASEPLDSLKMGTYFGTCLSLDGMYAASALLNTLDANKHVVYVRDAQGALLARKLIALTSEQELLGFVTYVLPPHDRHKMTRRIDQAVAQFAQRCGVALCHEGSPQGLHGERWYNDSPRPWTRHAGRKLEDFELAPRWPHTDQRALTELALDRARATEDVELWRAVAAQKLWPMCELALCDLMEAGVELEREACFGAYRTYDPPAVLASYMMGRTKPSKPRARLAWLQDVYPPERRWAPISFALWSSPRDPALHGEVMTSTRRLCQQKLWLKEQHIDFDLRYIYAWTGTPLKLLLGFIEDLLTLEEAIHQEPYLPGIESALSEYELMIITSWALKPQPALLLDRLTKTPCVYMRQLITQVLAHVRVGGAAHALERMLRARTPGVQVRSGILALGRQGAPTSLAYLSELEPIFPELAQELAIARQGCGDPQPMQQRLARRVKSARREVVRTLEAFAEDTLEQYFPAHLEELLGQLADTGAREAQAAVAALCELLKHHPGAYIELLREPMLARASAQHERLLQWEEVRSQPEPLLPATLIPHAWSECAQARISPLLHLAYTAKHAPERGVRQLAVRSLLSQNDARYNLVAQVMGEDVLGDLEDEVLAEAARGALSHPSLSYQSPSRIDIMLEWMAHMDLSSEQAQVFMESLRLDRHEHDALTLWWLLRGLGRSAAHARVVRRLLEVLFATQELEEVCMLMGLAWSLWPKEREWLSGCLRARAQCPQEQHTPAEWVEAVLSDRGDVLFPMEPSVLALSWAWEGFGEEDQQALRARLAQSEHARARSLSCALAALT